MLDHVLDLALHCQEKESEEVDQKDGPVVSVHSVGGVTGDFVRDTALCQKTVSYTHLTLPTICSV